GRTTRQPIRRPRSRNFAGSPRAARLAGALSVALALVAAAGAAHAQPPVAVQKTPEPQRVRLAMSRPADKRLGEPRVRRLLAVELGRKLAVEPEAVGPLGDEIVQVWVDLPDETHARIQVRRMERTLARRT